MSAFSSSGKEITISNNFNKTVTSELSRLCIEAHRKPPHDNNENNVSRLLLFFGLVLSTLFVSGLVVLLSFLLTGVSAFTDAKHTLSRARTDRNAHTRSRARTHTQTEAHTHTHTPCKKQDRRVVKTEVMGLGATPGGVKETTRLM